MVKQKKTPKYRAPRVETPKVHIQLTKTLTNKLKRIAKKEDRSITSVATRLLAERLKEI